MSDEMDDEIKSVELPEAHRQRLIDLALDVAVIGMLVVVLGLCFALALVTRSG